MFMRIFTAGERHHGSQTPALCSHTAITHIGRESLGESACRYEQSCNVIERGHGSLLCLHRPGTSLSPSLRCALMTKGVLDPQGV